MVIVAQMRAARRREQEEVRRAVLKRSQLPLRIDLVVLSSMNRPAAISAASIRMKVNKTVSSAGRELNMAGAGQRRHEYESEEKRDIATMYRPIVCS